jgi:hypothetical protein
VTLVFAWFAAAGIEAVRVRGIPRWAAYAAILGLAAMAGYQIAVWPRGDPDFPSGAASAIEPAILLVLFTIALYAFRSASGRLRAALAVALCASVFVDYKAHGTLRKFTSLPGDGDEYFPRGQFGGMNNQVFDTVKSNRHYRMLIDVSPATTDLRRYWLATIQGFDPVLPKTYWELVSRYRPFATNREFWPQPGDDELLQATAARYFITREGAPLYDAIPADPDFRKVDKVPSFYTVYEYLKAQPPWRWEGAHPAAVEMTRWEPERREFRVKSSSPGRLALIEQFYPGWRATVDGAAVPIARFNGTFQAIALPAGEHVVRFRYLPSSVLWGAAISAISLGGLWFGLRRYRPTASQRASETVVR